MAVFTVYEPPLRAGQRENDPARFAFVRDGFYWSAFFFAVLWMLWHRLWLALLGYFVVVVAVSLAIRAAGAPGAAAAFIALLLAILVGIEASTLRRWKLQRRGWIYLGVVVADDRDLAERRFFDAWVAAPSGAAWTAEPAAATTPLPPAAAPAVRPASARQGDVLGLFPEPGGRS